jgi:glycerol-3-phosphate acyltransferase PlsY
MLIVATIVGCYLIGSIPQAWIIAKLVTGKDLRQLGSGNLGVTNTALSVARWAGLLVFLGEGLKGIAAVLLMRAAGANEFLVALGLLAAVAGTRWCMWLGFAGGRGNTVGGGGLLAISWVILVLIGLVWVILRLTVRDSFRATRTGR